MIEFGKFVYVNLQPWSLKMEQRDCAIFSFLLVTKQHNKMYHVQFRLAVLRAYSYIRNMRRIASIFGIGIATISR